MKEIQMIETECNAWMEERERTLKKLMYHAKPEDRIKYQVQIDFLSIVKINMSKILREVKQ
jgi:hypothetical protein